MTTRTTALATIAAFAAMVVSASAFAAPPSTDADAVSVKVSLAGLALQSDAGARIALSRIHQAARQICGGSWDSLDGRAQFLACMDQVTDRAVAKLDSPMVTALNGPSKTSAKVIMSASR